MEKINYKSRRPVGGKPPILVVVDETGNIVNRNPSEDELRGLKVEPRKAQDTRKYKKYTDKELLDILRRSYEKYGEPPRATDFANNPEFPSVSTYIRRFGNFQKALKLVELDVDSMVKKGVLVTCQQKARLAEIIVSDHFKEHHTDLAGENCLSHYDGICPNGMSYEVKSSGLYYNTCYKFGTDNKCKEEIEIYYFLAFNKDYTRLDYGWRVPGEMVGSSMFYVGLNTNYELNVGNMEEYDITDRLGDILGRYGFLK